MGAAEIIAAIADLIAKLGPLAMNAVEAENAKDQAGLDAIQVRVVALSNALAPDGSTVVEVVQ